MYRNSLGVFYTSGVIGKYLSKALGMCLDIFNNIHLLKAKPYYMTIYVNDIQKNNSHKS